MFKPGQNFNFTERPLTICLVFKWRNLFDGDFGLCEVVVGGPINTN